MGKRKKKRASYKIPSVEVCEDVTTEHVKGNVYRTTIKDMRAGKEAYILLTSDWHFDSTHCDRRLLKEHLNEAKRLRAVTQLNGDLYSAIQGTTDPRRSNAELRAEYKVNNVFDATVEDFTRWIKPWNNEEYTAIAILGRGNHETSVERKSNLSLTNITAWSMRRDNPHGLPLPAPYGFYHVINVLNRKTVAHRFVIRALHGTGGAAMNKGVTRTTRRMAMFPTADIITFGHTHKGFLTAERREWLNSQMNVEMRTTWLCGTGTYEESWADLDGDGNVMSVGTEGWSVEKEHGPPDKHSILVRIFVRNSQVVIEPRFLS